ncbi:chaperonin GroEL [Gemmata sp. SH-PL17]|uniref:hypothetical protein n=1 Tax=Gemmata sp. SH-PL17 TaxID=1630693 RepID=UPI00078D66A7|nr:hypothetical protein [Gemmata sp. SH-PL17]AMV29217.1 chaperonin GroEL [Gemmata sp. SH-PL17]
MRVTPEELRASVTAVAKDVAEVYARLGPPFDDQEVERRFSSLSGAHASVANCLASAYRFMYDEFGDGGKNAVLIACRIVEAALDRLPVEGLSNLPGAIDVATARPAEWVNGSARLLYSVDEVRRIAETAVGGDVEIGAAVVEAFARAGPDGIIHVHNGGASNSPSTTVSDGERTGARGRNETIIVRGETDGDAKVLCLRAVHAVHAVRAAIAAGSVPGGGVAYALAAETLVADVDNDTISGLAARAVVAGCEAPLRTRGDVVRADTVALLTALRHQPEQAFDQTVPGLVRATDGPIDAARIVQAAIGEAGRTACDLLRMSL